MKYWITSGLLCLFFAASTLAASQVTKQRQQLFNEIEEQTEELEDAIDDKQWQQANPLAQQLANKAAQLTLLFPLNTQGEGRSRDRVWDKWAEFSRHLQNFEQNFRDAAAAIDAGNYRQAEDAVDKASSSCRSCHMSYRSLW